MKSNLCRFSAAAVLFSLIGAISAFARPIEFSEVSLLVRSHESDSEIMQQVRARKLLRPLTAAQESTLQRQGADAALIHHLRDSSLALSPAEADALNTAPAPSAKSSQSIPARDSSAAAERVRVFDVSMGEPINLSRWGGSGAEISFRCRRDAGEDIIEPVLVDPFGTYTRTAIYRGQGRPDDSTTIFDRREYASVVSYDVSRLGSIDTRNPVSIKGVPYLLYPVYGTGSVSLYYVGKIGDSVRVAVVLPKV